MRKQRTINDMTEEDVVGEVYELFDNGITDVYMSHYSDSKGRMFQKLVVKAPVMEDND